MSVFSNYLRWQIRMIKPVLSHLDVKSSRTAQDKLGALSLRVLAEKVAYSPVAGYAPEVACWATPKAETRPGVILYLHGGGYVAGSLQYAQLFGGVLAQVCQRRVFCLGYALAPEQPYPAALDDAYQAYRYLLESYVPEQIALVGESAGGGLLFCLTHRLIDEGLPLPACLVGISPWMDLTMSGASYQTNAKCDIALTAAQLVNYAQFYAPEGREHKYISPLFGSFAGFPPALLTVGGDEILLDEVRQTAQAYRQAGADCTLIEEPGFWHVYPLYGTPESKAAVRRIQCFVQDHLDGVEA